jgi:ornithine cyclodeaminase/alanine dehydrogenase-like protein (mu-crystallin family)
MMPAQQEPGTLLLTRSEVARLLDLGECIAAVEEALVLHAAGKSLAPGVLAVHAEGGAFHMKAAGLTADRPYFVVKTNANFPRNPDRFGLPTIQGIVLLADAACGRPLAVLDSMEITIKRTAAASAIAAKHLARPDAATATICGCGAQSRAQLEALKLVRPLRRAYAYDVAPAAADRFAAEQSRVLGIEVQATSELADAVAASDIIVTCTTACAPFLKREWIRPGTFIAAVGADAPNKQELEPILLSGLLVTDHVRQCAEIGELHHAIEAGLATTADVAAELHELVAGVKRGRRTAEEIAVFDSTGTALQDVAAAIAVFRKASATGEGRRLDFAA